MLNSTESTISFNINCVFIVNAHEVFWTSHLIFVVVCDANTCFRGVTCRDTSRGPVCGSCPPGYKGDGKTCVLDIITCAQVSCYPGVICTDTPSGYKCGDCPPGYRGDGQSCTDINEVSM